MATARTKRTGNPHACLIVQLAVNALVSFRHRTLMILPSLTHVVTFGIQVQLGIQVQVCVCDCGR